MPIRFTDTGINANGKISNPTRYYNEDFNDEVYDKVYDEINENHDTLTFTYDSTNDDSEQTPYSVTLENSTKCDILIVAGGGGGGGYSSQAGYAPGGGAGGLIFLDNQIVDGITYTVKVGKGGDKAQDDTERGQNGFNSSFSYLQTEAIGGGGGATPGTVSLIDGRDGGSGGGGASEDDNSGAHGQYGDPGQGHVSHIYKSDGTTILENYKQGFNGGYRARPYGLHNGAGGGAGGDGDHGGGAGIGKSGEGIIDFKTLFGIIDTTIGEHHDDKVYFAGGGGYFVYGGLGGGGVGWLKSGDPNGKPNTGGGGAGGYTRGNGGSGIVIIKFHNNFREIISNSANFDIVSKNYGEIIINNFREIMMKYNNWITNTDETIYHLGNNIGIGTDNPKCLLDVRGGISATTKNFKIEHPLDSNMILYHTSLEAPRYDNIYRGKTIIKNGYGEVNIDKECNTTGGMLEGTFKKLNKNYQLYLRNNETYDGVRGYIEDNLLKIFCESNENIVIDWLVIGERDDKEILNNNKCVSGSLLCEHKNNI